MHYQTLGVQIDGPSAQISEDTLRAFPDFHRRVAIAQEAAWEASKQLAEVRNRLGINGLYGDQPTTAPTDVGGEVDSLTCAIEQLTNTVREIRGQAETLNSRL